VVEWVGCRTVEVAQFAWTGRHTEMLEFTGRIRELVPATSG
jgi:hypothetical protein